MWSSSNVVRYADSGIVNMNFTVLIKQLPQQKVCGTDVLHVTTAVM